MISVETIFLKNDFLENIFRCLARSKKLRKAKIRVRQMSPESSDGDRIPATSGRHFRISASKFGWI
jgi:hypothetical protein